MGTQKQNDNSNFKKAVSVILMGTLCLSTAFGVTAFSQPIKVSDAESTNKEVKKEVKEEAKAEKKDSAEKTLEAAETTESNSNTETKTAVPVTEESSEVSLAIMRAFDAESLKALKSAGELKVETSDSGESVSEVSLESPAFMLSFNNEVALADKADTEDIEIKIEKWCAIAVDLRGKRLKKDVPAGTVADALAYLNIKLDENDTLNVSEEDDLEDGLKIVIKNVKTKNVTTKEEIKYNVITKETDELYIGETRVESEGSNGERTIITEETYINGKLDSEKEISNEVTEEAVDRVILKGTAEKISLIDTDSGNIVVNETAGTITDKNGNVLNYTSVLTGSSTAYTADPGAICSTGRVARYGVVAVNPEIIPYGSILYIVSDDGIVYGYAVAGDTGGFIYNGTGTIVDLYYPELEDCINYGRRGIHVYVLSGVSEDATYTNN